MSDTEIRYHVLLLDDDRRFLDAVSELFSMWGKGTWQVHTAHNTARALALLTEQHIDLAVVDVNMPVVDGVQFLRLIHQKYPQMKKVALTGYADENRRTECLANGAELYIEKPRSQEGFETVFATLNELLAWQTQEGFRGVLRKVGLQDIIQMECLGRNSSVLEIGNQQLRGHIYIDHGSIVHATAGELSGSAAFNKLLAMPGGEFSIKPFEPPPHRTIEGQWEFLLMEAAQQRDEEAGELARATEAAVTDAVALPAPGPDGPLLEEVIVCSGQGAMLYEWHSKDPDTRLRLFAALTQRTQILSQLLPLGQFDRLEITDGPSRAVVQLAPDRMLLVRVAREAVESRA